VEIVLGMRKSAAWVPDSVEIVLAMRKSAQPWSRSQRKYKRQKQINVTDICREPATECWQSIKAGTEFKPLRRRCFGRSKIRCRITCTEFCLTHDNEEGTVTCLSDRDSNSDPSAVQAVASRYTDCAIWKEMEGNNFSYKTRRKKITWKT
jgi:hypothetical protein